MASYEIETLSKKILEERFCEMPDKPSALYTRDSFPAGNLKFLSVVGARKYSNYGKEVCGQLISGLAGHPIVIVSNLALGIDAIAHKEALKAGLQTIAIPESGLDDKALYPKTNYNLSREILKSGGALILEYEPDEALQPFMFPKRNRIMAGLSDAVLVIEAKKKSGSLITADLGLSYNKDVGVVPGSIFNVNSAGTHALLYDSATPITSSLDILQMLGLEDTNKGATPTGNLSTDETLLIEALAEELYKDDAGRKLNWPAHKVNTVATSLTLKNLISDENGMLRRR